jgi:acetylornithine deacetylase
MSPEEILQLTAQLISCKSLTFDELPVFELFNSVALSRGLPCTLIPIGERRANLLVTFGTPRIVFTTHLDVVDGPEHLFTPRRDGDTIFGRGACDAKGIAATMLGVVEELLALRERDFALLLVCGEEVDGLGARVAAEHLKGAGVKFIVNGEPTELKLVTAHRGTLNLVVSAQGRAAHSGFPELGIDANRRLIELCQTLYALDFGEDAELGRATLNIGELQGGVASNVVSPKARAHGILRTVLSTEETVSLIRKQLPNDAEVELLYGNDPVRCLALPGFEHTVAPYFTDIPNFAALGAQAVLYGPGSIQDAHTDTEKITLADVSAGKTGYLRIFQLLKQML